MSRKKTEALPVVNDESEVPTFVSLFLKSSAPKEFGIATIIESPTNPRKTFGDVGELASSVRRHGILQPLLARPLPEAAAAALPATSPIELELVSGHRRLRAARMAGLETVPVIVRAMADVEVLEFQIVENCQRSDIHPLEEAEAYRQLHETHRMPAEEIAAKVGKSKGYIYGRLKLCALVGPPRTAFLQGTISAGIALLLARIPDPELQEKAFVKVSDRYGDANAGIDAEPLSYREAEDLVQDEFMFALKDAPFDQADAELVPNAGSCLACPKRTGNQRELFADVASPDTCTDPTCFGAKKDASWKQLEATAKAKGLKVLTDKKASSVFSSYGGGTAYNASYVLLTEKCQDDPKGRTWKDLLGKHAPPITIARTQTGATKQLFDRAAAAAALKDAGHSFANKAAASASPSTHRVDDTKRKEKEEACEAIADRAVILAAEKIATPAGSTAFMRWLAEDAAEFSGIEEGMEERYNLPIRPTAKDFAKFSEGKLRAFIFESRIREGSFHFYSGMPKDLVATLATFGVDVKKVEAEIKAKKAAAGAGAGAKAKAKKR